MYDEELEDTDTELHNGDEDTHSEDWGDTESQEERGFDDDDERDDK